MPVENESRHPPLPQQIIQGAEAAGLSPAGDVVELPQRGHGVEFVRTADEQ